MRMMLFCSGLLGAVLAVQSLAAPVPSEEPGERRGRRGERMERDVKGPDGARMLEHMTERLKLSEDQQAKVKTIIEKGKPELEKLQAEMAAMQKKLSEAMSRTREAIRETLTLEQKEKFDEMAVQMKRRQGGRREIREERRIRRGGPEDLHEAGEPEEGRMMPPPPPDDGPDD